MPPQKPEIVDSPQDHASVVMAMPVNPIQYKRDLEFHERAARRRDPNARLNAQATLDAAPKITTILQPTESDRVYGEAHKRTLPDGTEELQFPDWQCTYQGLRLRYRVGVPIEMPSYIYEQYAHNMRLPAFTKAPGEAGTVFSREIPDNAGLYEAPPMGR